MIPEELKQQLNDLEGRFEDLMHRTHHVLIRIALDIDGVTNPEKKDIDRIKHLMLRTVTENTNVQRLFNSTFSELAEKLSDKNECDSNAVETQRN